MFIDLPEDIDLILLYSTDGYKPIFSPFMWYQLLDRIKYNSLTIYFWNQSTLYIVYFKQHCNVCVRICVFLSSEAEAGERGVKNVHKCPTSHEKKDTLQKCTFTSFHISTYVVLV